MTVIKFDAAPLRLQGACVCTANNTPCISFYIKTLMLTIALLMPAWAFAPDNHGQPQETPHDEHGRRVTLSAASIKLAEIDVAPLVKQSQRYELLAPGELKANGYNSYIAAVRTESVIIARHVTLGEVVQKDQPLVTLFSEQVAQAQAQYVVAASEWYRIRQLDASSISVSERVKAQSNYNASYGQLLALGLTSQAINQISQENRVNFGQYQLVAQISGSVLNDDFIQGQRVRPSDALMSIVDERSLWVEARLPASLDANISQNTPASIIVNNRIYPAKVIQEAHVIDPQTRTRIVRLEVTNRDHQLHAGMFVDVSFSQSTNTPIYAVPQSALTRNDEGQWQIFVQSEDNEFTALEVSLGQQFGELQQITGVLPDHNVVMSNAFFLASELAKSSFDPHNH